MNTADVSRSISDLAVARQDEGDAIGNGAGERSQNQWLVDKSRMKERVTPPIGRIDARSQIVPIADFVYRLVTNDLLQDSRGR